MLRIGLAGFGKMGKIRARTIDKSSDVELVAVYDLDKHILPSNVYICNSFDELLRLDVDAIFICTYNDVAVEYTIRALEAGKHVFCEKPPATNCSELKKVKNVFESSNNVLKYGFNHRFHYSIMRAKELIKSGNFGRILWMRGVYGKAGSIDYCKNWRNYKKYSGGGILIDQGIHMLDLMLYFSEEKFTRINSFVDTLYWDIEVEDNAFIIMQTNSKITAMLHSSATQWRHKFLLEICLEKGYINLDGILSTTRSYAPEKLVLGLREFEDIDLAMGKPKEEIIWYEYDDSWSLELDDFLTAIKFNSLPKHGNIYQALLVMELIEEIYNKSEE
ncbi:MAG: hypothetical protein XD41_1565 [Desulfonauticus sp. 38_4375]|nr:MAG: hypothetical protein XD41_1565 [Desulfonauticus sp. 38_4375]